MLESLLRVTARRFPSFRRMLWCAITKDYRDSFYSISALDDSMRAGIGHEFWWHVIPLWGKCFFMDFDEAVRHAKVHHHELERPVIVLENTRHGARPVWSSEQPDGWSAYNRPKPRKTQVLR